MPSISDAILALERNYQRIELAKLELQAAEAEKKELERVILPPLFLQARTKTQALDNGTIATKRIGVWARFPPDDPKRTAAIKFLKDIGHISAIQAVVTANWGKGDYDIAQSAYAHLRKDPSAHVTLKEDVHWATYQRIVLETVTKGTPVPFDDINAEVYDEVIITKHGELPMEAK